MSKHRIRRIGYANWVECEKCGAFKLIQECCVICNKKIPPDRLQQIGDTISKTCSHYCADLLYGREWYKKNRDRKLKYRKKHYETYGR